MATPAETTIKNIDNIGISAYKSNNNFIVEKRAYVGSSFITGDKLTITNNGTYEKTFTDKNGNIITKQFDALGRTTCIIDSDGTIQPYTYISEEDDKGVTTSRLYNISNTHENETNLLTNGNFNNGLSNWTNNGFLHTTAQDYNNESTQKGCVLISDADFAGLISQTINVENGKTGDRYRITGWSKSAGTHADMDFFEIYGIFVEARNNITGNEAWESVDVYNFNPYNSNWHVLSREFKLTEDYNQIRISLGYYFQYGAALFDEISLIKTYTTTTTDNTSNESPDTTESCTCPNCIEPNCPCIGDDCSSSCTHLYCKRGYNLNDDTNPTVISMTDGSTTMSYMRGTNGNYLGSITNLNGETTTYDYDQANGNLEGTIDGNNIYTSYSHNAIGDLTCVEKTVSNLSSTSSTMSTSYSYEKDRLASITHNGFSYNYAYDEWGNLTNIKVNNSVLESYTYEPNTMYINTITYSNGDTIDYTYDENGRISTLKKITSDDTLFQSYEYIYDDDNKLAEIKDLTSQIKIQYTQNGFNIKSLTDETIYYSTTTNSNEITETLNNTSFTKTRNILQNPTDVESGDSQSSITLSSGYGSTDINQEIDWYGRISNQNISSNVSDENGVGKDFVINKDYSYKTTNQQTTLLTSSYSSTLSLEEYITDETLVDESFTESTRTFNSIEYHYDYDSVGNITRIYTIDSLNNTQQTICRYMYDEANQLIREDNAQLDKSYKYIYDNGGNITQKQVFEYSELTLETPLETINYTFDSDWKDKLVNYNDSSTNIAYDEVGNPLTFTSKSLGGDVLSNTAEWNGKQLVAVTNSIGRFEFAYNSDGLRTSANIYSTDGELASRRDYIWNNKTLVGHIDTDYTDNTKRTVYIIYDENNEPIGFITQHNGGEQHVYYYQKTLQGDIVAIYDETGKLYVTYTYDAWGNVTPRYNGGNIWAIISCMAIASDNPFAYRGYQYDFFTGTYYLQSRYYNPTYGRFLNADAVEMLDGDKGNLHSVNLFAYCNNNPIKFIDLDGHNPITIVVICLILIIVAVYASNLTSEQFKSFHNKFEKIENEPMFEKYNSFISPVSSLLDLFNQYWEVYVLFAAHTKNIMDYGTGTNVNPVYPQYGLTFPSGQAYINQCAEAHLLMVELTDNYVNLETGDEIIITKSTLWTDLDPNEQFSLCQYMILYDRTMYYKIYSFALTKLTSWGLEKMYGKFLEVLDLI